MTLTSRFTNAGLDLLADWTANPAHAKPFSVMKLGTLSDADYSSRTYDGSETDIKNPSPSAVLDAITVAAYPTDPEQAGSAVAKVAGVLQPNDSGKGKELRGERIREIGLFVEGQTSGTHVLVWIGTFPDQYIPTEEESAIDVQMSITVPVKFDNAAAVQVVTDNTLVEQRVTELENDVQTMNGGSGDVTQRASQTDMEKAAQCINKLNATGTPGTVLPDPSNVKTKADQNIVGSVLEKYTGSEWASVSPSNLWQFVGTMNGIDGMIGSRPNFKNAEKKASQADFEELRNYARILNTGSATSTSAAVRKANQSDFTTLRDTAVKFNKVTLGEYRVGVFGPGGTSIPAFTLQSGVEIKMSNGDLTYRPVTSEGYLGGWYQLNTGGSPLDLFEHTTTISLEVLVCNAGLPSMVNVAWLRSGCCCEIKFAWAGQAGSTTLAPFLWPTMAQPGSSVTGSDWQIAIGTLDATRRAYVFVHWDNITDTPSDWAFASRLIKF